MDLSKVVAAFLAVNAASYNEAFKKAFEEQEALEAAARMAAGVKPKQWRNHSARLAQLEVLEAPTASFIKEWNETEAAAEADLRNAIAEDKFLIVSEEEFVEMGGTVKLESETRSTRVMDGDGRASERTTTPVRKWFVKSVLVRTIAEKEVKSLSTDNRDQER